MDRDYFRNVGIPVRVSVENGLNYFIPAYAAEYGWSTSYLYGCQTIGYVIGCAAMIVMGRIIRKNGSKGVMTVTMGLGVIAIIIISKATTLALYSVGAILFLPAAVFSVGSALAIWVSTGSRKERSILGFATLGIVISMFIVNGVIFPYMQKAGAESAIFPPRCPGAFTDGSSWILVIRSNPEQAGAYPDNDRSISLMRK